VFFYVVYALALHRLSALRSLVGTIVIFIVFCILAYLLLYFAITEHDVWEAYAKAVVPNFIPIDRFANSFARWLIYVSPYFHLLEFIAGVLICQIFLLMRRDGRTMSRSQREVLGWVGATWLAVGAVFTSMVPDLVANGPRELVPYFAILNLMSMGFLLAPGCCALILALALGRSSIQAALAAPMVVLWGEASYAIYLAHPMISQMAFVTKENAYPLLSYIVAFFFLLIFSVALYRFVELPAKRFLRERFGVRMTHRGPVPGWS
jgi:peptidoglycan/LPS O-acetylase OafA/YrhL